MVLTDLLYLLAIGLSGTGLVTSSLSLWRGHRQLKHLKQHLAEITALQAGFTRLEAGDRLIAPRLQRLLDDPAFDAAAKADIRHWFALRTLH